MNGILISRARPEASKINFRAWASGNIAFQTNLHNHLLLMFSNQLCDLQFSQPQVKESVSKFMAYVHMSVNQKSKEYLANERRYNYTTPSLSWSRSSCIAVCWARRVKTSPPRWSGWRTACRSSTAPPPRYCPQAPISNYKWCLFLCPRPHRECSPGGGLVFFYCKRYLKYIPVYYTYSSCGFISR